MQGGLRAPFAAPGLNVWGICADVFFVRLASFLRGRIFVLAIAAGFLASGLWYGFFWESVLYGQHYWQVPGDIWATMRDAHYIAWGGFAAVYGTGAGLVALPGMPLLLAPVAALSSHLGLSEGFPFAIPHPTAWYLVGPVTIAMGTLPLFAAWDFMGLLGAGAFARRVGTIGVAVGAWPVVVMWGHPEDSVALALSLWALAAAHRGRWTACGWLLGAALSIQPVAVLALPIALGLAGRKLAVPLLARSALLPSLLLGLELIGDFHSTIRAFSVQPNYPSVDWPTPWMALAPRLSANAVAAGPGRAVAVALAAVVGLWVGIGPARRAGGARWIAWAAGVAFALRCGFEAVMVPYYVMPAVVCFVVAAAVAGRARLVGTAAIGSFLTIYTLLHFSPWPWYSEVMLSLGLMAWWSRPGNRAPAKPDAARRAASAQQASPLPAPRAVPAGARGA